MVKSYLAFTITGLACDLVGAYFYFSDSLDDSLDDSADDSFLTAGLTVDGCVVYFWIDGCTIRDGYTIRVGCTNTKGCSEIFSSIFVVLSFLTTFYDPQPIGVK